MCWFAHSACTPPLLAGVCGVGLVALAQGQLPPAAPGWGVAGCVSVCVRASLVPLPLLAGVLGCVCVFVCVLCFQQATRGWGVRCGCVCLGSGFGCAPPLLAGVLGRVCDCVRARLVPRHSWLGCAVWVCVLGLRLAPRPTTPGWGVGGCVCLCARSACTPPLLAGVCGVGVVAWARVSAASRYSWLDVGVCVCLCARSACTTHSWLGSPVCVLWLGFRPRPATPGWAVGVCVCSCARSACTPPLLAGVCGVGVVAWARVSGAPRHSWVGCWGVCVFLCALRGTPRLLAGVLGVCAWARVSAAPRHSWLGCWGVCVFVCAFRLYPATTGWDVRCGCVCLGAGFRCAPSLLDWLLGCVCVCVRAPLVPRHSLLGCAVCVCVRQLVFRLRPASSRLGVGVCMCLCARSACGSPLLAGVCGVGVCAWAGASAAPRLSWLGCVSVFVCALGLCPGSPAGACGVWVGCCLAPVPLP